MAAVSTMPPGGDYSDYQDDDGYFTCAVSVQHKNSKLSKIVNISEMTSVEALPVLTGVTFKDTVYLMEWLNGFVLMFPKYFNNHGMKILTRQL